MRPRTGIAAVLAVLSAAGVHRRYHQRGGRQRRQARRTGAIAACSCPVTCWSARATTRTTRASSRARPSCRRGQARPARRRSRAGTTRTSSTTTPWTRSFGVTSPLVLEEITPDGRPVSRHPGSRAVPDHELLLQVRGRAQPLPRRQARDVHRLRGRARHGRRVERQHPRRHRPDQPGLRRLLPVGRLASARTGSSPSPRPTPTAATTAGPRSPPTSTARSTTTPPATRATAATRSRTASSSARARRSSPRPAANEYAQTPGTPTPVGSFSVTELGDKADKVGKDDNFRGLTIYNNVLYYTKGSGSNGVDTVYFLDTTGTACPNGTGLPVPGAALPTTGLSYTLSTLQSGGPAQQHVHPQGLPDRARQERDRRQRLPVRHLVRQREHAVRGRRGRGRQRLRRDHRHVLRGRRVRHGGPAEVGLRLGDRPVAAWPTPCRTA